MLLNDTDTGGTSMRHPKNLNSDFWVGISLLIFSLFVYVYLIPSSIDVLEVMSDVSKVKTTTFPKIFTAVLGVFSLGIILTSITKKPSSNKTSIDLNLKRSGIVLLSIIAYYIFIDVIGFITASLICSYSIIAIFSHSVRLSRSWIIILLAFVATIYVFFERIMGVPFPHGLIY